MAKINASVGKGGVNNHADVITVQTLLNQHIQSLIPLMPLKIDGKIGSRTIDAIMEFQRRVVGLSQPDGRVDPNGRTLAKLNQVSSGTPTVLPIAPGLIKSGEYWVGWANNNAKNSQSIDDLVEPFKSNAKAFIKAVEDAGASVEIKTTKRDKKRAYLFHWSWKISLGYCQPADPPVEPGVPIQWDHGNLAASKQGAKKMVDGFGLAVPPASTNAPSLNSRHISGKAIDMYITWAGTINIKKKDGSSMAVTFMNNPNANIKLHQVGASYGVKKLATDAPHWSDTGG